LGRSRDLKFSYPDLGVGIITPMSRPNVLVERLVAHVNRKKWWHVPPRDTSAYSKRGKFFASSFGEAEFWGRPLDEPQKVKISRPLVGDETTIEKRLFNRRVSREDISLKERWSLDAKMKKVALARGYDSIVLMTPAAFLAFNKHGKVPRSIELNILTG
jgi:hypothetical protein